MDWAQEEMKSIDLGDKRLNARLHKVLTDLGQNPTDSIPTSCGSWVETKAAYRLFDNQQVTPEKILSPHQLSTYERMRLCPVVLLLQDTTTLNFTTQTERNDIGPINRENTRGLFLHPTLAVTPERHCLGVVSQDMWHREKLANQTPNERTQGNRKRELEDKESYRWLNGYRIANDCAQALPETKVVSVSDREGDIYDIFQKANDVLSQNKAYWLIRSHHKRKSIEKDGKKSHKSIQELTKQEPPLGYIKFELPARNGKKSRKVKQAIYTKKVRLACPDSKRRRDGYQPVEVTVIIASEVNLPSNTVPIEWVLLTNMDVASLEEASEKVQWYTCRWQIELYFKVLKSGCKIEKLQLSDKNFSVCLSLYMIIAWRILYLTALGRKCPELPCHCVFSREEWQTAFIMSKREKPPTKPPTLNDMIRMIAGLGGYMNRNKDGPPGHKTLWVGLRNMHEHIKAKQVFEVVYGQTYG